MRPDAATTQQNPLHELARIYGIELAYEDMSGRLCVASDEALTEVLKTLGAPIESASEAGEALHAEKASRCGRILEPVYAVTEIDLSIVIRLLQKQAESQIECRLECDLGGMHQWSVNSAELTTVGDELIEGELVLHKTLPLPRDITPAYYELRVACDRSEESALVIYSPSIVYHPESIRGRKHWGAFLPIHALRNGEWGIGDFTSAAQLLDWVFKQGGSVVGTLPFLPAFLEEYFFDPSPYSPVSRLFWNEIFINVDAAADFIGCADRRHLAETEGVVNEIRELRATPLVDYQRVMALKRQALQRQVDILEFGESKSRSDFRAFESTRPDVVDYAQFRAVFEARKESWQRWPERLREGRIEPGDYDPRSERYHLYAQWIAQQQVEQLADKAESQGLGLYLDMPVGVNSHGYDTWREREAFAMGLTAGAPPDPFFSKGQNWGFAPLHPQRIRKQQYRYFIASLRHQLLHASLLRFDHIMGLHRIFMIPQGMEASNGVYVHYRSDEMYSILCLESHRAQTLVIGEDLGTVPPYVREEMDRRRIPRLYVFQFETSADREPPVNSVAPGVTASLNTHDMPPFRSFWESHDIADRLDLGLLNDTEASQERISREEQKDAICAFMEEQGYLKKGSRDTWSVMCACQRYLAESDAFCVLVNMEDMWLEVEPQNTPGTTQDLRPNWQRKAKLRMDEIFGSAEIAQLFAEINTFRKAGPK